jgi:DeoR/GlpR family transcriptional regulator of sugar metabolism
MMSVVPSNQPTGARENGEGPASLRRDERAAHLLDLLARQSSASLAEMQTVTGASLPTLRRDLRALESRGALQRVRGGARAVQPNSPLDEVFELRRRRNASAKGAIAVAAAQLVTSRMAIFLPDGSTTLALAEELKRRAQPLSVATSALNIAARLADAEGIEVTVLGGLLRGSSLGTVGPLTTAALQSLRADIAFISPDRLDRSGPVTNSMLDAEVGRTMAANAARTVVVADASKFTRGGSARILAWAEVDDLVTDAVTPAFAAALAEAGVAVTIAQRLSPG